MLYQIVNSNVNYLNGVAVGSTVKSLRRNSFENMPFYIDGKYNNIEPILSQIHRLEKIYMNKIEKLKTLKTYYLQKFFK